MGGVGDGSGPGEVKLYTDLGAKGVQFVSGESKYMKMFVPDSVWFNVSGEPLLEPGSMVIPTPEWMHSLRFFNSSSCAVKLLSSPGTIKSEGKSKASEPRLAKIFPPTPRSGQTTDKPAKIFAVPNWAIGLNADREVRWFLDVGNFSFDPKGRKDAPASQLKTGMLMAPFEFISFMILDPLAAKLLTTTKIPSARPYPASPPSFSILARVFRPLQVGETWDEAVRQRSMEDLYADSFWVLLPMSGEHCVFTVELLLHGGCELLRARSLGCTISPEVHPTGPPSTLSKSDRKGLKDIGLGDANGSWMVSARLKNLVSEIVMHMRPDDGIAHDIEMPLCHLDTFSDPMMLRLALKVFGPSFHGDTVARIHTGASQRQLHMPFPYPPPTQLRKCSDCPGNCPEGLFKSIWLNDSLSEPLPLSSSDYPRTIDAKVKAILNLKRPEGEAAAAAGGQGDTLEVSSSSGESTPRTPPPPPPPPPRQSPESPVPTPKAVPPSPPAGKPFTLPPRELLEGAGRGSGEIPPFPVHPPAPTAPPSPPAAAPKSSPISRRRSPRIPNAASASKRPG